MRLLPCPFCEGPAHLGIIRYSEQAAREVGNGKQTIYHAAMCARCTASVGSAIGFETKVAAERAWNRRSFA